MLRTQVVKTKNLSSRVMLWKMNNNNVKSNIFLIRLKKCKNLLHFVVISLKVLMYSVICWFSCLVDLAVFYLLWKVLVPDTSIVPYWHVNLNKFLMLTSISTHQCRNIFFSAFQCLAFFALCSTLIIFQPNFPIAIKVKQVVRHHIYRQSFEQCFSNPFRLWRASSSFMFFNLLKGKYKDLLFRWLSANSLSKAWVVFFVLPHATILLFWIFPQLTSTLMWFWHWKNTPFSKTSWCHFACL